MLRYAIVFLIIALIAGMFGMYATEGIAMWGARWMFFIFIILFIVSLVMGRRAPPVT